MLIKTVEKILEEHNYRYYEYKGCFDIVASKRSNICVLKVLDNIDSVQENQANNLKILSSNISTFTAIIGTHTRRDRLEDEVIYERYGIPSMTPDTFENILNEKMPTIYRTRGGLFAEIDPEKLREARKNTGLTQKQLADNIGVTKKFVYENENKKMFSEKELVIELERILDISITSSIDVKSSDDFDQNKPSSNFEKDVCNNLNKLGFTTNTIHKAPFNIIAKEDIMLLSDADDNEKRVKKNMPALEAFSEFTKSSAVIISENKDIASALPVIEAKELKNLTINEFKKLMKST